MSKEKLINRVKEILKGIDSDECETDDGWWETSKGAEFGKSKLNELISEIEES